MFKFHKFFFDRASYLYVIFLISMLKNFSNKFKDGFFSSDFKINVLIRSILFFFIYLFLIYEKISVITLIPILLIVIFNLLVILISKRENLEKYRNSNQNIFDVKVIK